MEFVYCDGFANAQPSVNEYPINIYTNVKKGDVIFMDIVDGIITNQKPYSNDYRVIGVAMCDHLGTESDTHPNAKTGKILVCDSRDAAFRLKAAKVSFNLEHCSSNQFAVSDSSMHMCSTMGIGGCFVLVEKGKGSTNTDNVGDVRHCTSGSSMDTGIPACFYYVEEGGTPCAGDVYCFIPGVGDAAGCIDRNDNTYYAYNSDGVGVIAVGRSLSVENGVGPCVYVKLKDHIKDGFVNGTI